VPENFGLFNDYLGKAIGTKLLLCDSEDCRLDVGLAGAVVPVQGYVRAEGGRGLPVGQPSLNGGGSPVVSHPVGGPSHSMTVVNRGQFCGT